MIINDPFHVEYTGLKRFIGSAALYKDNLQNNHFPSDFDLTIPLQETNEKGKSVDEYFQHQQQPRPGGGSTNIGQKRVEAPPSTTRLQAERGRPSLMGNAEDAKYIPISVLNTFVQDWTIKAKVVRKNTRNWNNARGNGTLMNVDLMDKHGCQIQATFFNDAVSKFTDVLQENKVYTFTQGQVKVANKKYTTIPNDFCLVFDTWATIIEQQGDETQYQGGGFNFTTLKQVQEWVGDNLVLIDVIGVITEVEPLGQITVRSTGEQRDKRTVTLTDDTNVSIKGTFWGDAARVEYKKGDIIACSGARVSDYQGKSLNFGDHNILNPVGDVRYKEIKEWYEDRTSNGQELKPESLTQAGGENAVPMSSLPITFIENMTRMDLDDQAFINREDLNPRYHRVVGWIKRIFTNRDMHYTSCPGPDCKKKVNPGDSGLGWYCEKCQKTYQTCNYTYNFSILVEDITGSGIYQVMGDQIGE